MVNGDGTGDGGVSGDIAKRVYAHGVRVCV